MPGKFVRVACALRFDERLPAYSMPIIRVLTSNLISCPKHGGSGLFNLSECSRHEPLVVLTRCGLETIRKELSRSAPQEMKNDSKLWETPKPKQTKNKKWTCDEFEAPDGGITVDCRALGDGDCTDLLLYLTFKPIIRVLNWIQGRQNHWVALVI